jgi:hypothetical protein
MVALVKNGLQFEPYSAVPGNPLKNSEKNWVHAYYTILLFLRIGFDRDVRHF